MDVKWDVGFCGTSRYLRRYEFDYVGPVRSHWEHKQYVVNGLDEDVFWVDGEMVTPVKMEACCGRSTTQSELHNH